MMELRLNKVVDVQLVQSNEVEGSYHTELKGLKRSVAFLTSHNLQTSVMVTDRHLSIQKWIRENMPDSRHFYDVWHVAKGLSKKLEKLAQQQDCYLVREWIRSISNHMYWCASSTQDHSLTSGDLVVAKCLS